MRGSPSLSYSDMKRTRHQKSLALLYNEVVCTSPRSLRAIGRSNSGTFTSSKPESADDKKKHRGARLLGPPPWRIPLDPNYLKYETLIRPPYVCLCVLKSRPRASPRTRRSFLKARPAFATCLRSRSCSRARARFHSHSRWRCTALIRRGVESRRERTGSTLCQRTSSLLTS